jgi:hypothetical protein
VDINKEVHQSHVDISKEVNICHQWKWHICLSIDKVHIQVSNCMIRFFTFQFI